MSRISLEGMEFFAYHGCITEEQIIGTKFLVDLHFDVDTAEAEVTDNLSKTVNYQKVYHVVKREMGVRSNLLESLCRRILSALLKEFPRIAHATIKVSKQNPSIGGKMQGVSVTLSMP